MVRFRALLVAGVLAGLALGAQAKSRAQFLKPPRHGGVYVVAHRGAHLDVPENTLPAYRRAIELGVDFVEVDVRVTKDGHFVSRHNDDLGKYVLGPNPGRISELTLAEVRAVDVGARVGPRWKGTRVPTFEEILDLCKGKVGIYLDLKNAPVEPLVQLIRQRGMERDVLWYAYSDSDLFAVQRLCPKCVIMPDPGPVTNLPVVLRKFHPVVVASVWKHCSKSFVEMCHRAGAMVIVDDHGPETWRDLLNWGVDGIQTDHPGELIELLEKRERASKKAAAGSGQ